MLPTRFYCCSALLIIGLVLCVNVYPSRAVSLAQPVTGNTTNFMFLQERHVEFLATNYTFNTKYFKNFTVSIANKTLNMDMELARPIQRGFKAHVDYQLRVANAKNFQTIFSHHFDVCAIVSNVKDGLLKSWFKSMLEYSNFMHNCPVEVGYYYLHNWKLGSTMTHQFLYPGEYRGQLYLFYGKYKTKTEDRVITLIIDSILYN